MLNRLVFVRHGEAQNSADQSTELYGALSEKGRAQINRILPKFDEIASPKFNIIICSSLASRSFETAQIIANHLKVSEVKKCAFIADGDINGLYEEIQNTKGQFCMIITGHEPYLSYWTKQISGYNLPYEKGSAVCFDIISNNPIKAVPVCFAQSGNINFQYREIEGYNPKIKEMQTIISHQLQEILASQMQFWKFPDSADSTGKLFLKLMAFRSTIEFFKSMMNQTEYEDVLEQLDDLIINFTHLYEKDLLAQEWRHLAVVNPELNSTLAALLTSLQSARRDDKDLLYKQVFENMTTLLFKLLLWVKAGNLHERDLHNLTVFRDMRSYA